MSRKTTAILLAIALLLSGIWLLMWLTGAETTDAEPHVKLTPDARPDTNPTRAAATARIGIAEARRPRNPTLVPADPRDMKPAMHSMRAGLDECAHGSILSLGGGCRSHTPCWVPLAGESRRRRIRRR